jgi:broad specificity phosphatase PhoE
VAVAGVAFTAGLSWRQHRRTLNQTLRHRPGRNDWRDDERHSAMNEWRDVRDVFGDAGPPASSSFPTIYLCRHGETSLNAGGRLRGRSDPDLNAAGREQADALAVTLQPMKPLSILASPLRRALETADAIATGCGLTTEVSEDLVDRDYGPQNGQLVEKVNAIWGSVDNAPGVEPWGSVLTRAQSALAEAATRANNGPVVLVSHDAVNSALLAFLDPGRWADPGAVEQPTGCLNVLRLDNDIWVVVIAGLRPFA